MSQACQKQNRSRLSYQGGPDLPFCCLQACCTEGSRVQLAGVGGGDDGAHFQDTPPHQQALREHPALANVLDHRGDCPSLCSWQSIFHSPSGPQISSFAYGTLPPRIFPAMLFSPKQIELIVFPLNCLIHSGPFLKPCLYLLALNLFRIETLSSDAPLVSIC